MKKKLSVAVVGAGMGGLAVAATLRRVGIGVQVYEQAPRFARIGAGIQMMPNSMKVLRGIGIEDRLRKTAFAPYSHLNRDWDSGELTRELPMPESLYDAPYLCMHRADLHDALASAVPGEIVHLGTKARNARPRRRPGDACGSRTAPPLRADAVDRRRWRPLDCARHRGRTGRADSQRAHCLSRDISRAMLMGSSISAFAHQMVGHSTGTSSSTTRRQQCSEVYFVTSVPEPAEWLTRESWSAKGDVQELRAAYEGFHPDVRDVLEACPDCHKWAILEREPLPRWSDGRVVLLGDACHPMTPYMAQGAATAIEDAAILARCLEAVNGDDVADAFRRYEAHRKPRTSLIQAISSANTWMKDGSSDTTWLYGYDAWNANLDQPAAHPRREAA